MRIRQQKKFLRFVAVEAIAVFLLFISITIGIDEKHRRLGLNEHEAMPRITPMVTTLTLLAAAAAGIIPVIFYALPPKVPRDGDS